MDIAVWIGINLVDLLITIAMFEMTKISSFTRFEINPFIKYLSYPNGFIIYKIVIALLMIPVLIIISTKYKNVPKYINLLYIAVFLI